MDKMLLKLNLSSLFLILLKCSCAEFIVRSAMPLEKLNEIFFREHGWLGADGIYSCKISESRSIWHFADTFLGDRKLNERTNWNLLRNSVGIQRVFENSSSIDFYWTHANYSDSFYLPPDGQGWFWAKACTYHENKLHILLSQLDNWGPDPAWDYGVIAAWHAVIENPTENPTNWKIRYSKMPFIHTTLQTNITFDASILHYEDYFYIYGFNEFRRDQTDIRDFILARVKVDQFENYDAWDFYSNGNWVKNFRDATMLFDAAGEFSVHYENGLQQFLAVYSSNFPNADIFGRTAPTPSGPWSDPVKLYSVPEMYDKSNIFCYSGKVHPQMSGDNYFVLSYACNSFNLSEVINNGTLYMPKFVQINY